MTFKYEFLLNWGVRSAVNGGTERQASTLERSVFPYKAKNCCIHKGKNTLLCSIFVCLAVYLQAAKYIYLFRDTYTQTYKVCTEVDKEHKQQTTHRALPATQSRKGVVTMRVSAHRWG